MEYSPISKIVGLCNSLTKSVNQKSACPFFSKGKNGEIMLDIQFMLVEIGEDQILVQQCHGEYVTYILFRVYIRSILRFYFRFLRCFFIWHYRIRCDWNWLLVHFKKSAAFSLLIHCFRQMLTPAKW